MSVICIGGSSGVGKTTIANLIQAMVGDGKSVHLSGDDLHKWERNDPEWKNITHLSPFANDLDLGYKHILELKNNNSIYRKTYNHSNGLFDDCKAFHPKEYIIYSGLHALYGDICNIADIKIFIDTNKELKNNWKINRDTKERHKDKEEVLKEIQSREQDEKQYIEPQRYNADVILEMVNVDNLIKIIPHFNMANNKIKSFIYDLLEFYESLSNFILLCQNISFDIALVQNKGGNISIKHDNRIIIKSSGAKMTDVNMYNGYCVCDLPTEIPAFNSEYSYSEFLSKIKTYGHNNPSMETGMHLTIKDKIVCHTHPIHLNAILCSNNSQDILREIFPQTYYDFVEYTTPGFELAEIIKSTTKEKIIFLQNHGLIVSGDNIWSVYNLTAFVNNECRDWMIEHGERVVNNSVDNTKPLFPDAAVLDQMKEINNYILHLIACCGLKPNFLSDDEVSKLKNMSMEKHRKELV